MPRYRSLIIAFMLGCLVLSAPVEAADEATTGVFPDLEGWSKDGKPATYTPDNLFEYINGAAELYLSFGFERLASLNYDGESSQSLTIDVYEHGDARQAFGIYSQEKPGTGNFLKVGTQGYYEQGILNFFQDKYYVKVAGFGLGNEDRKFLAAVAEELSGRLGGKTVFPAVLTAFPEEGKIANSERYVEKNVFGRGFLHAAFVADYEMEGRTTRVFIIEAADKEDAKKMLDSYLKLIEKNGGHVLEAEGHYRFEDPLLRSRGAINIRQNARYLWGLFTDDVRASRIYLYKIEANLRKNGMIE